MKLKKKIWVLLLSAVLVCSSTLTCFAASQQWVEVKPARLVSYTCYESWKCSVCGAELHYNADYVLEGDLNGRKAFGYAKKYPDGYKEKDYDFSGDYYCVNPNLYLYTLKTNYEAVGTAYFPAQAYNHLLSHGTDQYGNNARLNWQLSVYYNHQFKSAEGYFTTTDSKTTEVEKTKGVDNSTLNKVLANVKSKEQKQAKTCPYVKTIKVKKGKKSFTAKWKKASKKQQKQFTGYQIQYSTKRDFSSNVKTKSTTKRNASKVVIRKLKKKTIYYVRLRKYLKSGKNVIYSNWSKVKKVKTK